MKTISSTILTHENRFLRMMNIKSDNTSVNVYISYPKNEKGPGILVLHAWWGLNKFVKELSDRLAGEGFFVVAPDLYEGKVATTIEKAEEYANQVDSNVVNPKLQETVDFLVNHESCSNSEIAVLGISLGAAWANWLANNKADEINKVILFYGTGTPEFSDVKATYLCHFADNDPYEESEWVQQFLDSMKKSGVEFTKYVYPETHHWFFESDNKEYFKKEQSELAWKRTLKFLHK